MNKSLSTLRQEYYDDENGYEIKAELIDFIAPYSDVFDGFFKWSCGGCKEKMSTRAFFIFGVVFKCSHCQKQNLLLRTDVKFVSGIITKWAETENKVKDLERREAKLNEEVERKVKEKVQSLMRRNFENAMPLLMAELTKDPELILTRSSP